MGIKKVQKNPVSKEDGYGIALLVYRILEKKQHHKLQIPAEIFLLPGL